MEAIGNVTMNTPERRGIVSNNYPNLEKIALAAFCAFSICKYEAYVKPSYMAIYGVFGGICFHSCTVSTLNYNSVSSNTDWEKVKRKTSYIFATLAGVVGILAGVADMASGVNIVI